MIELAVVVLIITLLLGSILVPLSTQVEQRQVSEAQRMLEQAREALIGHAVTFGYLPCPDLMSGAGSNDGQEDVTGSVCTNLEGNLPWATLGVSGTDPWGNRFRYRVDTDYSNHTVRFGFTSTADQQVCTTAACSTQLTSSTAGARAVAVILSHGRNGFGARSSFPPFNANPAPASADELENTDSDPTFVSRPATSQGSTAGEFDDIVVWLSRYTLFNRMVSAGKLP